MYENVYFRGFHDHRVPSSKCGRDFLDCDQQWMVKRLWKVKCIQRCSVIDYRNLGNNPKRYTLDIVEEFSLSWSHECLARSQKSRIVVAGKQYIYCRALEKYSRVLISILAVLLAAPSSPGLICRFAGSRSRPVQGCAPPVLWQDGRGLWNAL